MPETKEQFLRVLEERFGKLQKLGSSRSLFGLGNGDARVYIRYSKVHERGRTFFGLRKTDLGMLEGHRSFVCFLWDGQKEPLVLPYDGYEDVFNSIEPAHDGQYKVQVSRRDATDLYIAKAGRFNVDAYFGVSELERAVERQRIADIPKLSHAQVQTLLGAIGVLKGYELWIPQHDVVWVERGGNVLNALYEVEHSTTIYSGLLRLNDVHLVTPQIEKLAIVADEERRSVFSRHLSRPTFRASSLSETCAFLNYQDVYQWYQRIRDTQAN